MASSGQKEELVVIAVDGSKQAEEAFDWYCNILHREHKSVLLLTVSDLSSDQGEIYYLSLEACQSRLQRAIDAGDKTLEPYKKKLKDKNIAGKSLTKVSHNPGETIVSVAQENKASLVVVGTRGLGRLRRTIMGSVSDYVVHHAHCPVLVFRH